MLTKFALKQPPRQSQVEVLKAIEQAYQKGYRIVLLEAPVGSGKSAIAVTVAKHYGPAHILTPRKSLQDQYRDDFQHEDLITMKGRSSYPCFHPLITGKDPGSKAYQKAVDEISKGLPCNPLQTKRTCATGPCTVSSKEAAKCTLETKDSDPLFPCPYKVAIAAAQKRNAVVHNVHSFIYQTSFANYFEPAPLLIVDECHDVEGIVRGFSTRTFYIPRVMSNTDLEITRGFDSFADWADWFSSKAAMFSDRQDSLGVSERDEFLTRVESFKNLSEMVKDKFVRVIEVDRSEGRTIFRFTPEFIGNIANRLLYDYGKKVLLMSGTIYSKSSFCRDNGLKEEDVCFIRIGSSFPKANRPIYSKPKYQIDTSHKLWDQNFEKMCDIIEEISEVFSDAKGLIHTPSYTASAQILAALKDRVPRLRSHTSEDFLEKLQAFYDEEGQPIFLSPICQQGVDFKYDRARFQIVLRVPYMNTSDEFVKYKVENDFRWYNHQALVLFGQQMGRVNRAGDDYGATILVDARFNKFISKNRSLLPKWLTEAIIYK